ncbi:unnamed protein product [Protopolystoma xenopodis]|uniref:Uncharacterized protein n=1 Tax=Protopolystoma xenopodis TaxID=117903 RepID=A0A448XHF7_9PLAT|nr:unnamed protein product [Protopolystoma xenopodis]
MSHEKSGAHRPGWWPTGARDERTVASSGHARGRETRVVSRRQLRLQFSIRSSSLSSFVGKLDSFFSFSSTHFSSSSPPTSASTFASILHALLLLFCVYCSFSAFYSSYSSFSSTFSNSIFNFFFCFQFLSFDTAFFCTASIGLQNCSLDTPPRLHLPSRKYHFCPKHLHPPLDHFPPHPTHHQPHHRNHPHQSHHSHNHTYYSQHHQND